MRERVHSSFMFTSLFGSLLAAAHVCFHSEVDSAGPRFASFTVGRDAEMWVGSSTGGAVNRACWRARALLTSSSQRPAAPVPVRPAELTAPGR